MRWVLSVLCAFQCENTPSKHPILALLQRNAKVEYANYNNINTLHFCILQFAKNGGADWAVASHLKKEKGLPGVEILFSW